MKKLLMAGAFLVGLTGVAHADEHQCLAEAMYYEARDQGSLGMLAVGIVIQNRVDHPRYPDTICEVVRQGRYWKGNPVRDKCQFSYWCDGRPERPAEKKIWGIAQSIAHTLLSTEVDIIGLEEATHYHADWVKPSWASVLEPCSQIGQHIFYAEK